MSDTNHTEPPPYTHEQAEKIRAAYVRQKAACEPGKTPTREAVRAEARVGIKAVAAWMRDNVNVASLVPAPDLSDVVSTLWARASTEAYAVAWAEVQDDYATAQRVADEAERARAEAIERAEAAEVERDAAKTAAETAERTAKAHEAELAAARAECARIAAERDEAVRAVNDLRVAKGQWEATAGTLQKVLDDLRKDLAAAKGRGDAEN